VARNRSLPGKGVFAANDAVIVRGEVYTSGKEGSMGV
jgi:hypothetical protein